MRFEKEALERLSMWEKGKKAPPLHIDIEPSSSCNLKCRFCWTRSKERVAACQYEKTISNKRLIEIVKEGAKLGVLEWEIAGGWEPLVKKEAVFKMMKLIKKYGMYGSITTNGTLFTEKMIKKLVEIEWDRILFSLEAPDAKTHDFLTQVKGSFEKETRNIYLFKKWKEKLKREKPEYSIHAVLTNKNYNKLAEMIELGYKLGCTGVNFEPLMIWSEEGKKLKLEEWQEKELNYHINEAVKLAKKLGIHTNLMNWREEKYVERKDMRRILKEGLKFNGTLFNSPCFMPWLNLEIRVSGRVVACRVCNDENGCENIMEKGLKEIWFGRYFENLRKEFLKGNLPEYCKDCASGLVVRMKNLRKELRNLYGRT